MIKIPKKEVVKPNAVVADDDEATSQLLEEILSTMGVNVQCANDGEEAWKLIEKSVPDLVLLDVMMPRLSGWEICKRIKSGPKSEIYLNTRVLMLTGIGEKINDMTSSLFSADAWLDKPFDLEEFQSVVLKLLGKQERKRTAKKEFEGVKKKKK